MDAKVLSAHLSAFARCFCYAALFLCYLTNPTAAQESAATPSAPIVEAPSYRVGDQWTLVYGRTDSKPGTSVVQTVVTVTENETTFSSARDGRPPHDLVFDGQGNATRVGNDTWVPSMGSLCFPMTVGKSWDFHHVHRFDSGSLDVSGHAEVVAFERVQVLAGTFDAFKIESRGVNNKMLERLYSAPFRATYWYAPSVKRVVKSKYALYLKNTAVTDNFELGSFSLAP